MNRESPITSPAEPAPRSPATVSPVGRVPALLAWLFPSLGDLSENPVYIRLSGQGYGRRGAARWIWGPREFRYGWVTWRVITRLGIWPFAWLPVIFLLDAFYLQQSGPIQSAVQSVGIECVVWTFQLLATRTVLGRPSHWALNFYRRSRLEGWAEDLILSDLDPGSIKRAIFAVAGLRVARRTLLWVPCSFAVLMQGSLTQRSLDRGMIWVGIAHWIATWVFFTGLECFDIANALRSASLFRPEPAVAANSWKENLRRVLVPPAVALLLMFPSIVIQFIGGFFMAGNLASSSAKLLPLVLLGCFNVLLTCNFFRLWIDRRLLR